MRAARAAGAAAQRQDEKRGLEDREGREEEGEELGKLRPSLQEWEGCTLAVTQGFCVADCPKGGRGELASGQELSPAEGSASGQQAAGMVRKVSFKTIKTC